MGCKDLWGYKKVKAVLLEVFFWRGVDIHLHPPFERLWIWFYFNRHNISRRPFCPQNIPFSYLYFYFRVGVDRLIIFPVCRQIRHFFHNFFLYLEIFILSLLGQRGIGGGGVFFLKKNNLILPWKNISEKLYFK